jgi:uncharacterized protein (TIGR00304 family)
MRLMGAIKVIKSCYEVLNEAEVPSTSMDAGTLQGLGIALIFVGMLVILVAVFLLFLSDIKGERKVKGGGAVIIGPFPIIFGTDKESVKTVLLLSLALTILLMIAMVIFYLVLR